LAKKQLQDWGIDYFDLYLIHFPISLQYVDPAHRYPPEWYGDDKKVHLRESHESLLKDAKPCPLPENTPIQETWTCMEELVDEGLVKNIGLRYPCFLPCNDSLN
jgi:D-xylose reductase